jgi:hypothetical protein
VHQHWVSCFILHHLYFILSLPIVDSRVSILILLEGSANLGNGFLFHLPLFRFNLYLDGWGRMAWHLALVRIRIETWRKKCKLQNRPKNNNGASSRIRIETSKMLIDCSKLCKQHIAFTLTNSRKIFW